MNYSPLIQNLISTKEHLVDMLRLDLIDAEISGNKWFKLKNNIEAAKKAKHKHLITFGGAFSNHLAATAAACKKFNFQSTGIVRGEANLPLNTTLAKAKENGMNLHFVSREFYDKKEQVEFKNYLAEIFGQHYLVPEGGNNEEGILGCMEIMNPAWNYDYVFCACGTAATYTGILAASNENQKVIGLSVLKGENELTTEVNTRSKKMFPENFKYTYGNEALEDVFLKKNCIINLYAFNGYAKYNEELISFKKNFELKFNIPLDYIYTSKLVYGVFDLIKKKKLKEGAKILIIHSGGLQGNLGFETRYHLIPSL